MVMFCEHADRCVIFYFLSTSLPDHERKVAVKIVSFLSAENHCAGNTLYVGLGVSGQPKDQPWRWAKSLTSILCFIVGSFVFSRAMRYMGALRRSTVVLSFLIQAILTLVSAALVQARVVPNNAGDLLPDNLIVLLPLALLALQSAGQIIVSRMLGYGELTSVVLTSAYCDLLFDQEVLTAPLKENVKRNRRVASMVMMLAGAISGGFLTRDDNIALALWIAGAMKMMITITWMFWKSKEGSVRLE